MFSLLPPSKDRCQECGEKHPLTEPHNPQSLHFKYKFSLENGRSPTWADAMKHCSEETQERWMSRLTNIGIDLYSTDLTGGIKTVEERDKRIKNQRPDSV